MTLTKISPESFEIANAYLELGSVEEVANTLMLPMHTVSETLATREIKDYLDGVYLDMGYRNRNKLGALLDKIIDAKLKEAEETEVYTSKDLLDLIQMAHKMRMDELKVQEKPQIGTNINVANFGEGNYGKLMEKLMSNRK